jgi:hypothetical protein
MPAAQSRPAPGLEFSESERVSRPAGLWLLTIALLVSPIVHLVALWFGQHWLNFGSRRPWDGFVYLLIAPLVGTLMLRRHERARFSVYVFLSCEILRADRIRSLPLGLIALGAILYLQLPAARRFHPSVDPRRVLERIRLRRRDSSTV